MNDAWRACPDADVLYACDTRWWEYHNGVPEYAGEKWTQSAQAAQRYGLRHIESIARPGFSLSPRRIHQGLNSGYQAVNLALHFGARRILLLGFDMGKDAGGRKHFFGDHPEPLNMDSSYGLWVRNFRTTLEDLARIGAEVINCSRRTALDCYPRMTIEEALS